MKKRWEEPKIMVQKFMPNEYVAACGDSGRSINLSVLLVTTVVVILFI